MEHYMKSLGRVIASVVLLGALLISIGLVFAFVPLYLAFAYKGRGKASSLLELVPIGILGGLLWRLWKPTEEAKYEELQQAYSDGREKGYKEARYDHVSPTSKRISQ